MSTSFAPKFTIICAVYQMECYLREAIDSLLNQTLSFRGNTQLILVDDGSTDKSLEICHEYQAQFPDQVIVLHQSNAGQASARNHGLRYASGKYICFMDPDDKLASDALDKVWRFFEEHEQETDIVAIPMFFFEARTGPHWQNTKFNRGSRVIDLTTEYRIQQTSTSSAFFHERIKHLIHFDENIYSSEDFKVNLEILAEKQTLGVVDDTRYLYRRRASTNFSTIQLASKRKPWFTAWFSDLCDWACDFYTRRFGMIPPHVQYAILCDLSWRIVSDYEDDFHQVLTPDEQEAYRKTLGQALNKFEDQYIFELPNLTPALRIGLFRLKYSRLPDRKELGNDILLHYGAYRVGLASSQIIKYDFISVLPNVLRIEGQLQLYGIDDTIPFGLQMAYDDGSAIPCSLHRWPKADLQRLDMCLRSSWKFTCDIPLHKGVIQVQPQLVLDGCSVNFACVNTGLFVPWSQHLKNDCFHEHGWTIARSDTTLRARRSSALAYYTKDEFRKWIQLLRMDARKAALYRMIVFALRLLKRKPIWIISDRPDSAGDNGEALYVWLRQKRKKQVNAYFVIGSHAADYQQLSSDKHVVPLFSMKHRLLHMLSDCVLSSGSYSQFHHPFDPTTDGYLKDIIAKPLIFLQHGIIKDDLSDYLAREKQGLSGFVTSAQAERNSILSIEAYGYSEDQVWLTGLPRHDRLENRPERTILITPTWRRSLFSRYDGSKGRWAQLPGFEDSMYVQFFRSLLNHPALLKAAEKYGYRLIWAPHPNIRPYNDAFHVPASVQIADKSMSYRELFSTGSLLVTDYSSVLFDFAYLKKPIIMAHFDRATFYDGQIYDPGYFDCVRDGFGPVCTDLDSLVETIITMMKQDCVMPAEYRQRAERFYAFNDKNNSARVAERVFALMSDKKQKY